MYKRVIARCLHCLCLFVHVIIFVVILYPQEVQAEGNGQNDQGGEIREQYINQHLNQLQTNEIEQFWQKIRDDYQGFLPENQPLQLKDFFQMDGSIFSSGIIKGWLKYLFQELWINGKLLGMIVILTVFSMLLQHIHSAFENTGVSKVAYAIVYLVILVIAVNSFHNAMDYAKSAISSMVHFMMAMIPLVLALMASVGNITSVALFHPLIIFLVNTSGLLIYSIVFPLLFFSTLLGVISTFSDQYKVTKLASMLKNIAVGILGIFLTIFLGVISVQGATAAVVDGVTIKAAKFITGNFVPIVGRMFTDATDTVIGASLLVKNTVGLAGVVIIIMLCAFPAIKILALAIIFNLSAAILQPLGSSNVTDCLSIIGKNLLYIFGALATVCLMFFLAITIIIAAGNLSIMVR